MRRIWTLMLGAAMVAGLGGVLAADEADDMFKEIKTVFEGGVNVRGKNAEEANKALEDFGKTLIERSERYAKAFPKGKDLPEVLFYKAMGHYVLARVEDKDKNLAAAAAAAADAREKTDPKGELAGAATRLILQVAMMRDNVDAMKEQVDWLTKNDPKGESLAMALHLLARTYERLDKQDEAIATYKRLADECPDTQLGQRAKGQLRKLDLVGSTLKLSFTSVSGKKIDIKDYRGKVVLIDFWASWCPPCKAEMPNLVETYNTYKARGFEIIGVSLDSSKDDMDAFMKKAGMTWPQHFDGKKWKNEISTQFGIDAIPATILVDKEGKVVALGLRGTALVAKVRELLGK